MSTEAKVHRVGIVGFGALGQYLAEAIARDGAAHGIELAFVWNRTPAKLAEHELFAPGAPLAHVPLDDLSEWRSRNATLVLEVAHPSVTLQYAAQFLEAADYLCGSPTALADVTTETAVREALAAHRRRVYVPAGALWGAQDIARMRQRGSLRGVHVTMAKHPSALRLSGELLAKATAAAESGERVTLYDGPARALCPLAPNNVNTIACAALAGVGFDETRATLVADASLESHDIDIAVRGPDNAATGTAFRVETRRINPAAPGAVTGSATYASFFSSLLDCVESERRGGAIHFV